MPNKKYAWLKNNDAEKPQEVKFELRPEGGAGVSLVVNGEVQCGYRNGLCSRFWSSGMLSVVKGDT